MPNKKTEPKNLIDKIYLPPWLIVILVVVFLLRIPSFFEPFSYGDEMIYLTLGNGVRQGLTLYRDIHDNKPPFLYLLAGAAGNVFWFRVILAFWMLGTTVLFWKLTQKLFPKNLALTKVALWVFAIFTTIPLLEGQISNSELFMIGPIIAAFLILYDKKKYKTWDLFGAGLLFSAAALFKIPAAFDLPVIIVFWFIMSVGKIKDLPIFLKNTAILAAGFLTPLVVSVVWYFLRGAGTEYLIAAFGQNVGYLSSFRPDDVAEPFLVRNGPLLIRAGVVALGSFILWLLRKKLSKQFIFASLWILFSLFAVALSERPYPHYLIQAVPSAAILVGMLVARKSKEQVYTIVPLTLLFFVPYFYGFWHYPTLPYYERFANFAIGNISREEYFDRFEGDVNNKYRVAKYLRESSREHERVFVWGSNATIYALSRRLPPIKYTTNYHINDFYGLDATLKSIAETLPAFVIITPDAPYFAKLQAILDERYLMVENFEGYQIWKSMDTSVIGALKQKPF